MPDQDTPCAVGTGLEPTTTDSAGVSCPWHTTTSEDPEVVEAVNRRQKAAQAKADGVPPWTCPSCHKSYPGVTLRGTPRRGCPNPKCAGRARHLVAEGWLKSTRDQCLLDPTRAPKPRNLSPDQILAIRNHPGGQRVAARECGVSQSTVWKIRAGVVGAWVPDTREQGHV